MHCVGTAASASEGIARAAELQPNIVVMDIEMPRQDGLQATRRIREVAPDTVIAVVTGHNDPAWISRAAQAGASAFIPKGGSLIEMIDILGRVCHGQMIVAPSTFDAGPSIAAAAGSDAGAAAHPARAGGAGLPGQGHVGALDQPGPWASA